MARRLRNKVEWPAWLFNIDGETQLFECAEDVPEGWTSTPPSAVYETSEQASVDKEKVIKQLEEYGVELDPRWGAAKLQEVLKELNND